MEPLYTTCPVPDHGWGRRCDVKLSVVMKSYMDGWATGSVIQEPNLEPDVLMVTGSEIPATPTQFLHAGPEALLQIVDATVEVLVVQPPQLLLQGAEQRRHVGRLLPELHHQAGVGLAFELYLHPLHILEVPLGPLVQHLNGLGHVLHLDNQEQQQQQQRRRRWRRPEMTPAVLDRKPEEWAGVVVVVVDRKPEGVVMAAVPEILFLSKKVLKPPSRNIPLRSIASENCRDVPLN
ncbi:hypothetical protein CRUP_029740 [Coryphaenoides rupestris]|nr:hypothetical protein CRUP_029740 [Coryphaenoides rupestris]